MNNKHWSLVGVVTCLVAIGYLGGLFTKDAYYTEYERYDECEYTTADNFDVDNWWESIDCEDEQKAKGVKPTIMKRDCSQIYEYEEDIQKNCDIEQVFDPRGTLLVILIIALGGFVLSYRRAE